MNHDIEKLEREIRTVHQSLERIVGSSDWKELFKLIHFPGYTTPAEFYLIHRTVQTLAEQTKVIAHLQQTLIEGSHVILEKTAKQGKI